MTVPGSGVADGVTRVVRDSRRHWPVQLPWLGGGLALWGLQYAFELVWRGVLYGTVDAYS